MNYFRLLCVCVISLLFCSCSLSSRIGKLADRDLLKDSALLSAHTGISIYEPAKKLHWLDVQAHKYFVPASNVKLLTLFAGLNILKDSVPSVKWTESSSAITLEPLADPTFLQPDFPVQKLAVLLKNSRKKIRIYDGAWKDEPLGMGWSWDDYSAGYMAERSAFPVYGNVIRWTQVHQQDNESRNFVYSEPEVDWKVRFNDQHGESFSVLRNRIENSFEITEGKEAQKSVDIPFITARIKTAVELLKDTLHQELEIFSDPLLRPIGGKLLYSQSLDSLLRITMHRSDNFFAEQTLLMCSQQVFGEMNDERIIDSVKSSLMAGLPDPPHWVDGSGLSRYNMVTPADFVWLIDHMIEQFGIARIDSILPSGNEGTLHNYYVPLQGNLFAKTGTLSGQVAISGHFTTKQQHHLVFSVLVNNHAASSTRVRRAVEKMILDIYNRY